MRQITQDILEVDSGMILHAVGVTSKLDGGFSTQLCRKYPEVAQVHKSYVEKTTGLPASLLGDAVVIAVTDKLVVANMLCVSQRGENKVLEYSALSQCLRELDESENILSYKGKEQQVFLPYKMGAGANAGEWSVIAKLVDRHLPDAHVCLMPQQSVSKRRR